LLGWYTAWLASELRTFAENLATALDDLNSDKAGLRQKLARIERRQASQRSDPTRSPIAKDASSGGPLTARARSRQVEETLDYLEFEDKFRGSPEEILRRQLAYVEHFKEVPGPVVDLGCGRGEFLSLLAEAGLEAYGVDQSADMVALCQEQGLKAFQGDALAHLTALPEASLGGLFSAQMIEHLDPDEIVRLFELAADRLAKRGVLVVETLNPQSLSTYTNALYADLGHLRPLHPHVLLFLAERAGFSDLEIRYTSPIAPENRLKPIPEGAARSAALESLLIENFQRIDEMLFGPQDFAVIARK
jgi:SAM-dependent methyltransferase